VVRNTRNRHRFRFASRRQDNDFGRFQVCKEVRPRSAEGLRPRSGVPAALDWPVQEPAKVSRAGRYVRDSTKDEQTIRELVTYLIQNRSGVASL
jgi:hypothetical protein